MNNFQYNWSDVAFGSKKTLDSLKATFIAAPRQMSNKRFAQLLKEYLPKGNVIVGIAKEDFVDGFDGQVQFRMLKSKDIQTIVDKVNSSPSPHKVYILEYFQRELDYILQKNTFQSVILVNGSWKYAFHNLPQFYTLANKRTPIRMVSPFVDELEAKEFEAHNANKIDLPKVGDICDEHRLMQVVNQVATLSYDYCFQIGVVLAKKVGKAYRFMAADFNKAIPYQSYILHNGSVREQHFSPPNDQNHYDTIHGEMALLVQAHKKAISFKDAILFLNVLPCPSCARTLCQTDLAEIVYNQDHSDGYAVKLFEQTGKKVRRIV